MDVVFRAFAIYALMLLIFRLAGRRSLAEMTSFDFVLLLIIGEATQQALLGDDFSVTNGVLAIVALVTLDVLLSLCKQRFPRLAKVLDGLPMIVVENGRPLRERMRRARIDDEDVLEAARSSRGLERLDQIKYAVLEISGGISIVPRDDLR
ncbi:MAG: DUF421 domain-containing protein [Alphaproteobacteria bacterium]|nr:MAG: DUF421 domain-containing protein [Alphaproteobacteria bacterium]